MNGGNYLDNVVPNYWETCKKTQIDGSSSEKRIPICLCLDLSGSMWNDRHGTPSIERLKKGIRAFFRDIKNSDNGRSAEVAIVGFVNKGVILQDFELADSFTEKKIQSLIDSLLPNYEHLPMECMRCGDLEAGVQQSLCVLDARKKIYQQYGIPYCQPMLVLMSDGVPTRGSGKSLEKLNASRMEAMIADIGERRKSRKLSVIAVYCARGGTEDAEAVDFLKLLINPNDEVYPINDKEDQGFEKFFVFLSMSVSAASRGKAVDVAKFNEKVAKAMDDGKTINEMNVDDIERSFSDFYDDSDDGVLPIETGVSTSNDPELEEYLKSFFGGQ